MSNDDRIYEYFKYLTKSTEEKDVFFNIFLVLLSIVVIVIIYFWIFIRL